MDYLKQFVIPFAGLKAGSYNFAFEIDDEFFAHFEHSEVRQGRLHVDCIMERQQRMLVLNFQLSGLVSLPCDRCAEDYDQPISGQQKLIVKFGTELFEESEEILVIPEKAHELDVSQYVYEYIHLLLPMKRVHGNDERANSLCNPDVITQIIDAEDTPVDPRWEALKKLKNNLE